MLIPTFGSCPSNLTAAQDEILRTILGELGRAGLEWRSLGKTDYPSSYPLREVLMLAKRCSGGVILGFSQFESATGVWKKNTPFERKESENVPFPTPWNNLEAGILFTLNVPLLVFREEKIRGGIFDNGVTDLFIQDLPKTWTKESKKVMKEVIRQFSTKVHAHYYSI